VNRNTSTQHTHQSTGKVAGLGNRGDMAASKNKLLEHLIVAISSNDQGSTAAATGGQGDNDETAKVATTSKRQYSSNHASRLQ